MTAPARAQLNTRRLGHILDRLGSNFDGEALAAARRAAAVVRAAGVTWDELLDPPVIRLVPTPPAQSLDPDAVISAALMRPAHLSVWELHFVNDLAVRRPRRLSERQLSALRRIADKLALRGRP